MKKKLIIAGACLIGVFALVFGIYQSGASSSDPELSKEEVEKLVQEQYPGTVTTTELEKNEAGAVYKVRIESKGNNYAVTLDGNTGEVIDLEILGEAVTENSQEADNNHTEETDSKKEPGTNNEPEQSEENKENNSSNAMLSQDAAREIALNEFAGTVVDIELDEDDGRTIYEIEIENGDDEATVEIDAYTGEILVLDIDIDD
ncbi:PepSY domain-containing protein [Oceanobacillus polygoni]|uniref:Membrane protein YkoI n=1 Tax=Oceanobacillus polygoni TaxID=1235259 RepID=A0A9X0YW04_9BACI|nr:PepSY domain-containing protein [Oceanobacillus polygoni]MBP2079832.1 putative membrane protein YkoI [Oceanobacillus polygoni]